MSRPSLYLLSIASLIAVALIVPSASAHERYSSPDGSIIIVLGEQNEPVYTYDFTNLDLIVSDNATGDPITGVEETLQATLIAPNNEELSMPIEAQHGSEGRYQFVEDYVLTMPGQYKVRLDGTINGVDVSGEYLLPGPRGAFTDITFPHADVADVRELQEEHDALEAELEALRAEMEALQAQVDSGDNTGEAPIAGFALTGALVAVVAALRGRRDA